MASIQFQECEWEDHNGRYEYLMCTKKGWTSYDTSEAGAYLSEKCIEREQYKAWVWALASAANFWSIGTVNSGEWTCEGFFGQEIHEGIESLS